MMNISRVTYRRSKQRGYDEYQAIEVSADLNEQEDANEVLADLQKWVHEKLQVKEDIRVLLDKRSDLENKIAGLEKQCNDAVVKWGKVREFLEKLGIKDELDEIPF